MPPSKSKSTAGAADAAIPTILAQQAQILREIAELRALLPLSVAGLQGLAELQQTIIRTTHRHLDPRAADLKELADRLADKVGAELAERNAAAWELRLETLAQTFGPVAVQLMQQNKAAAGDGSGS